MNAYCGVRAGSRSARSDERRKAWFAYVGVLAAIPAAYAVESLARVTVLARHAATMADLFGETMRRVAWVAFGLTVTFGLLAMALRPVLRRRYTEVTAVMAGASLAQSPAVLACALGLLGADPLAVGCTVAASTAFVAWHWPG